jgi:hypothetical protein
MHSAKNRFLETGVTGYTIGGPIEEKPASRQVADAGEH